MHSLFGLRCQDALIGAFEKRGQRMYGLVRSSGRFCPLVSVRAGIPESFKAALETRRWVGYSPSTDDPSIGKPASKEEISKDLALLKTSGFDGIVTYGCLGSLGAIPRLAAEAGIHHIILGIWDPKNAEMVDGAGILDAEFAGH